MILQEGGQIGDIYGYITEGVYGLNDFEIDGITPKPGVAVETGAEEPGSMRFADLYKDGKITSDDRTVIGNSSPDFYGAFGTNFSWKNLDLNLSFQYSWAAMSTTQTTTSWPHSPAPRTTRWPSSRSDGPLRTSPARSTPG